MKNVLCFLFIVSLCVWGCGDNSNDPDDVSSEGTQVPDDGDTDTIRPKPAPENSCVSKTCNGAKVCLMNDALNCGKCGNECPEGVPCENGECKTDKTTDPEKPGPKDPEPKACDGKLCNDECVDVHTDVRHCGECGHACGDNQHCRDSKCECDESSTMCLDVCVDLKTDKNNCGECGTHCGEGMHCSDAKCVCDDTLTMCSDACVDLKTDNNNCGACGTQCGEGLHCSDAKCECNDPMMMCSDVCVDLKTDNNHCGSCETKCGESHHCSDAKCECDDPALTACSDTCVNIKTDNNHCGACGTQCGESQHCSDMKCVCEAPLTMCSNTCVNLKTDKMNCGACGTKCSENQVCRRGSCKDKATGGMAVIEYVEQFLYEDTYMCTYDHKDSLPGFCDFKNAGENYTCGYNLNCANFVITCLRNTGELTDEMYQAIPSGSRCAVEGVRVLCEERNTGYRVIQAKDAQPGDIWYWKDANHSHTEFVASVKDGKLTTVGSNNIRTAIQQPPCKKVCEYSSDPGKYQAVIYTDRNLTDGKVCSKR